MSVRKFKDNEMVKLTPKAGYRHLQQSFGKISYYESGYKQYKVYFYKTEEDAKAGENHIDYYWLKSTQMNSYNTDPSQAVYEIY